MRLRLKFVGAAVAFVACAVSPAHGSDGFWRRSYQPDQPIHKIDEAIERFNKFDRAAEGQGRPADIADYLRSGIILSNLACEHWLDTLGRADRDAGFAKDVLNIVGNLILGISGINGANPSSLARGSLAIAAGNASIDSFKNEVILGAISDIEAKLNEGRKITAATIRRYIPTTTNYDDAKGQLLAYHRDCSPHAVKNLLKTSLAAVKYQPADTTLAGEIAKAQADVLASKLSVDIYGEKAQRLTDDELYQLYLGKIVQPGDSTFIESMISANSKKLLEDFSIKDEAKRKETLKDIAILRNFGDRYKTDKLAAQHNADRERQEIAAQTEAAAKAVVQSVVSTQKALPAVEAARVANTPELKDFFARPTTQALTPALTEQLSANVAASAARGNKSAKNLEELTKNLETKQAQEVRANEVVAEIAAAPEPKATAPEAAQTLIAPVSVNAVLVPTGQTK